MKLETTLREQLADLARSEGLELLDAEVSGSGSKTILRLIVDSPGGVSIARCAAVSRQASALLDVADPFRHHYTLEVSSPGLDRKLYSQGDYRRFSGQQVKVRMQPTFREHRVVTGELIGLEDEIVTLRNEAEELVELPVNEIFEARLVVDWKSVLDERKRRS